MSVIEAGGGHFEAVKAITRSTIKDVYPLYYPKGAVDFFLTHHNDDALRKDIQCGFMYLCLNGDQNAVGTVTVKANEICRLFVLPQYQKQGFGRELLDFAESRISQQEKCCVLDASLPAKALYLKRGYVLTEAHSIKTASGDFLCYDVMRKSF